jgi:tRNA pseudouridine55 synthase
MTLEGILPIWKPVGFTSHDVVAKVRRIVKIKRIGHTGTLDPAVTGVLPLCIGRATRLVEYIQELPKEYEAVLKLGLSTDTEDMSGTVLERLDDVKTRISEEQVKEIISGFVGDIEQVPPMYSAVKVEGKRLYELARQGVEVERKSRTVTILRIETLSSNWDEQYPEVRFRVLCSKGTYIRTLCVDIGKRLGVPSVMAHLIRTSTGNMGPEVCLTLEQVEQYQQEGRLEEFMIPMEKALSHMPSIQLEANLAQRALQGQKIRLREAPVALSQGPFLTAYGNEQLLGIFEWDPEHHQLLPVKIFS